MSFIKRTQPNNNHQFTTAPFTWICTIRNTFYIRLMYACKPLSRLGLHITGTFVARHFAVIAAAAVASEAGTKL